jgi:Tfp pilus assembly protein PilZ
VNTITPKDVGEEFNIEFEIPKTDIRIICRARVIWNRRFSQKGANEPGMGLKFVDLDPDTAAKVEDWVFKEVEAARAEED